jgi:hypothetical protein
MMLKSNLVETIADKNEFVKLCGELGVPTLPTLPFDTISDYFENVRSQIDFNKPQILKPVSDRIDLEDRRRRFFLCDNLAELDSCVDQHCHGIGGGRPGFQIQQYVDFRQRETNYYNTAFKISDVMTEHITTKQLINLSAIEENKPATHWGNMHAGTDDLLEVAKMHARRLASRYMEMGYIGELGIDYGISGGQIFFLETNARINNATRLYYYLLALGMDPENSSYIYIRNSILEFLGGKIEEFRNIPKIKFHPHPEDKALIISSDPADIDGIYEVISVLSQSVPPFPG